MYFFGVLTITTVKVTADFYSNMYKDRVVVVFL